MITIYVASDTKGEGKTSALKLIKHYMEVHKAKVEIEMLGTNNQEAFKRMIDQIEMREADMWVWRSRVKIVEIPDERPAFLNLVKENQELKKKIL